MTTHDQLAALAAMSQKWLSTPLAVSTLSKQFWEGYQAARRECGADLAAALALLRQQIEAQRTCGHGWHFGGQCNQPRRPTIGDKLKEHDELRLSVQAIVRDIRAHVLDVQSGPPEVADLICLSNVELWAAQLAAALAAGEEPER